MREVRLGGYELSLCRLAGVVFGRGPLESLDPFSMKTSPTVLPVSRMVTPILIIVIVYIVIVTELRKTDIENCPKHRIIIIRVDSKIWCCNTQGTQI